MKKLLYVASTYEHIQNFHLPYLDRFTEKGFKVYVASRGRVPFEEYPEIIRIDMPFKKSIFSPKNWVCAVRLLKLINKERFEAVSAHTALAAFFARIAVRFSKGRKPIVVYTVHGYLFEDNPSSIKQYIKKQVFLAAERIARSSTNVIMVMNDEDYKIAEKYKLYTELLVKIPGMGIDTERFSVEKIMKDIWDSAEKGVRHGQTNPLQGLGMTEIRRKERWKLELTDEHVMLIYVAEFSERKNQKMLIEAMTLLPSNVRLFLAGRGEKLDECIKLAQELGVGGIPDGRVWFLGQVKNIENYYFAADICVSASKSEGLPFNIMESMSMGLPIIATDVKGHRDLVKHGVNGYLYEYDDKEAFVAAVLEMIETGENGGMKDEVITKMKETNALEAKEYELHKVMESTLEILSNVF